MNTLCHIYFYAFLFQSLSLQIEKHITIAVCSVYTKGEHKIEHNAPFDVSVRTFLLQKVDTPQYIKTSVYAPARGADRGFIILHLCQVKY